jgi:hypothetical protein
MPELSGAATLLTCTLNVVKQAGIDRFVAVALPAKRYPSPLPKFSCRNSRIPTGHESEIWNTAYLSRAWDV